MPADEILLSGPPNKCFWVLFPSVLNVLINFWRTEVSLWQEIEKQWTYGDVCELHLSMLKELIPLREAARCPKVFGPSGSKKRKRERDKGTNTHPWYN